MIDWQSPEWGMAGHNVHGVEYMATRQPLLAVLDHPLVRESSTGSWLEAAGEGEQS